MTDKLLREVSDIIDSKLLYVQLNECIAREKKMPAYKEWAYYYCEERLYLVKNLKIGFFVFIEAGNPYEAIMKADNLLKGKQEGKQ